jgi:hypothetical protein
MQENDTKCGVTIVTRATAIRPIAEQSHSPNNKNVILGYAFIRKTIKRKNSEFPVVTKFIQLSLVMKRKSGLNSYLVVIELNLIT